MMNAVPTILAGSVESARNIIKGFDPVDDRANQPAYIAAKIVVARNYIKRSPTDGIYSATADRIATWSHRLIDLGHEIA